MNAKIREQYEAPVLTNETIEKLCARVDNRFDSLSANMNTRFDNVNELREGGDAELAAKIAGLTETVIATRVYMRIGVAVAVIVSIVALAVSIARNF